ncbi:MAG: hypothetical protein QOI06_10 [Nocardioidaceae bacterium]|jgi:glycerophosphoryl diester phosphodiesterase|nr:hypothetical protein [Nocardioidaceae bacterium]
MKHRHAFITVGLAFGGWLLLAPPAQAMSAPDSTPCGSRLISAHEGYRAIAAGDTVASQRAAFSIGANLADADLWVTEDGHIVEMHDNDVSYSTGGTGLVTQMTLSQVLALRTTKDNDPIPQLSNSLNIRTAHAPGRYLMLETKFSFAKTANLQLLDNEIQAANMVDHVIIYSEYLSQVQYLKQIDPALTVWYKAQTTPPITDLTGLDGVMLPAVDTTKQSVLLFHTGGYTVIRQRPISETPANWTRFVRTKADGLMTDQAPLVVGECRAL